MTPTTLTGEWWMTDTWTSDWHPVDLSPEGVPPVEEHAQDACDWWDAELWPYVIAYADKHAPTDH